jgi:hypothetical protein
VAEAPGLAFLLVLDQVDQQIADDARNRAGARTDDVDIRPRQSAKEAGDGLFCA